MSLRPRDENFSYLSYYTILLIYIIHTLVVIVLLKVGIGRYTAQ